LSAYCTLLRKDVRQSKKTLDIGGTPAKGDVMPKVKPLLSLILLAGFLMSCALQTQETGTLKGHVSIGPLVPVLREGVPEPTPAPEVYAARQIVISKPASGKEIARVGIGVTGDYQVQLPVGTYIVDINHGGVDMAKGLPAEVEITSNQVTLLDIDIDTGIR